MSPQETIAHYRITTKLGEGGMGEVWRATDTKLNRDVAIKVLPDAFAQDRDRMARFAREAQVLASLNHPNIAAIYGVEERAIVMELVEGDTLAGALSIEQALPIIHQLIDALEYAHERGVVHRDLKPANIKVTRDGRVKVLDFGLAKAMSGEAPAADNPATSPTLTMRATMAGMIMGTAAYMSPEQARGQEVDKRADIWAFGVVVYEMLTGRALFDGPTMSDMLAAVLRQDLDLGRVPEPLRRMLNACLVREARRRMRDIGDARLLLEQAPATVQYPASRRLWAGWAAAALMAVIAVVTFWVALKPKPRESRPVMHFTITAPVGRSTNAIALSRDGSRLAYVGGPRSEIYVRQMDQLEAKLLPGTQGAFFLAFSPDGEWISYVDGERASSGGHLKKIPVSGGPAQTLAEVSSVRSPPGHDWGDDGTLVFASEGVLYRIHADGSQKETIATPEANSYSVPQFLPGGTWILSATGIANLALNLRTREKKVLTEARAYPRFAPSHPGSTSGHLVYYAAGTGSLMARPFDAETFRVGSPVRVLDGVQGTNGPFGAFAFSDSGTLAYVAGVAGVGLSRLIWMDRRGVVRETPFPAQAYQYLRLSPDGKRAAVQIGESTDSRQRADIWVLDLDRGSTTRITSEDRNFFPVWTPDSKRLIYLSDQQKALLISAPADKGSPPPAYPIATEAALRRYPSSVSLNGKLVIGRNVANVGVSGNDFWVLPLSEAGAAEPKPFLDSRFRKANPQFSPDGGWVAYDGSDTGISQIYVTPYPGPGPTHTISTDGGRTPRWSQDGRELFYLNGDKVIAVEVQTKPVFQAKIPKVLFARRDANVSMGTGAALLGDAYDVSPDGKQFLMLKPEGDPQTHPDQLHVIVNWFEELRRRAPLEPK